MERPFDYPGRHSGDTLGCDIERIPMTLTHRQLNTVITALKLAEVRFGMFLQLAAVRLNEHGNQIPTLDHDWLGDWAEELDAKLKEAGNG